MWASPLSERVRERKRLLKTFTRMLGVASEGVKRKAAIKSGMLPKTEAPLWNDNTNSGVFQYSFTYMPGRAGSRMRSYVSETSARDAESIDLARNGSVAVR